jgi:signal transduction histidine kinase/DNA-binding response OmpR family regulator
MTNDARVDILVVDDLPEKLLVYETILESLDQNVVSARSGREALRYLLEHDVAVILLDVNMPVMDGFETAAIIRGRLRSAHTPIIFVTALGDELNTAQGYSLGAVDYILTPIVPEILRTKVGVFVELYKKTQQVKRQAEEHIALARAEAAREAAERTNRRLAFLAEASTLLVQSLDHDSRVIELASMAVPFLADRCAVTLIDEHDPKVWKTELAWIDPRDLSRRAESVDANLHPHLAALIGRALTSGQTEFYERSECRPGESADNLADEAHVAGGPEGVRVLPDHCIVVPIKAHGRILGTIFLGRENPRPPITPEELALAADLAGRAAIAIDNARLYHDVQENNRRKNEFLAMLAHELRNPLAPIRTAVDILRLLPLKDATLDWANDVISRQLENLVRLVDDLLDISRITGGKIELRKEPIEASAIVSRAVEISRPLIDARKQRLTVTLPDEPIWINADLVRLAQVVGNLLNNAAKYTPDQGEIGVSVARYGNQASFRVRDDGIGIAPEKLASIFDLFIQVDNSLDRSNGGLGIGLTLVRQIVELHEGTVAAHSEGPMRGSEFVVLLPLVSEPHEPATVLKDEPTTGIGEQRPMLALGGM